MRTKLLRDIYLEVYRGTGGSRRRAGVIAIVTYRRYVRKYRKTRRYLTEQ